MCHISLETKVYKFQNSGCEMSKVFFSKKKEHGNILQPKNIWSSPKVEYHHQNSNFAKVFKYKFWMKGSMNRKRVEEVREAKTKLEAQKAETVVKIQEVGNVTLFMNICTAFQRWFRNTEVGNITLFMNICTAFQWWFKSPEVGNGTLFMNICTAFQRWFKSPEVGNVTI